MICEPLQVHKANQRLTVYRQEIKQPTFNPALCPECLRELIVQDDENKKPAGQVNRQCKRGPNTTNKPTRERLLSGKKTNHHTSRGLQPETNTNPPISQESQPLTYTSYQTYKRSTPMTNRGTLTKILRFPHNHQNVHEHMAYFNFKHSILTHSCVRDNTTTDMVFNMENNDHLDHSK